ncbi:MAG: hypothetical protein MPEBLZ_03603 [Candidatus Methanoperedens nitroreducens]|uniref:Lipoprotein n=1 Tax=Candidatus Methanoperedens nitratireducens TaxID=1392998 RepID=A0A0P7ZEA9_9EURY|nr:hypothetical protein [Candidatus Methanoperedens sp. BLZ2]KAB2946995.1 MAG: hypothetical protein F9K14_06040 [Candidatus Methanoperedens sp.]KPQ41844.1 MAG: hypothetical protein MPEBLZ_03603 [Candidatus Methanoperedens sp. BLZ1]MBZ0176798.1 hypothetical protein [Candidatus Methanoperedens nitroreducens]MCX9080520.1 hypothetical protein [Candidatus Methanoperedens sp.]
MKLKLFAAIILLASLFSGCVSNNAYIGTYKLDKTPSKTLELREDGTYLLVPVDPKFTQKGVYVKRGSTIEITNALGFTSMMNITDDGLLEDNGDRWIRVTQK